jgi:anti-anti-sigma factor
MAAETLTLSEITNIAGVAGLHATLSERIQAADGELLVVDCSEVRTIDAASLQCLLMARRQAKKAGGDLQLRPVSEDFERNVDYVGLRVHLLS